MPKQTNQGWRAGAKEARGSGGSGVLTERKAPACAMTDRTWHLPQTDSDFRGSLPYEVTESMFHAYA